MVPHTHGSLLCVAERLGRVGEFLALRRGIVEPRQGRLEVVGRGGRHHLHRRPWEEELTCGDGAQGVVALVVLLDVAVVGELVPLDATARRARSGRSPGWRPWPGRRPSWGRARRPPRRCCPASTSGRSRPPAAGSAPPSASRCRWSPASSAGRSAGSASAAPPGGQPGRRRTRCSMPLPWYVRPPVPGDAAVEGALGVLADVRVRVRGLVGRRGPAPTAPARCRRRRR